MNERKLLSNPFKGLQDLLGRIQEQDERNINYEKKYQ